MRLCGYVVRAPHCLCHRSACLASLCHAGLTLFLLCAVLAEVAEASPSADYTPGDPIASSHRPFYAHEQSREKTKKLVYVFFERVLYLVLFTFLSAVCAGLTLGVMCADTLTLEVIAESGPMPESKYAATVLPLRRQGHKTLCTLILFNMLFNVLIVQEFAAVSQSWHQLGRHTDRNKSVLRYIATVWTGQANQNQTGQQGASSTVPRGHIDETDSLYNFVLSTVIIVLFAEIIPMAVCKSRHSLMVAAAGSTFVRIAMVLSYPIAAPLGKLLDAIVGSENAGQIYDRHQLRRLMVMHYERREDTDATMAKTELNLLLAAMDFHELTVRDAMTPIANITHVHGGDVVTADLMERLWLSGRSRVPVMSTAGEFCDVLLVKDLINHTPNSDAAAVTVEQIVSMKNRPFVFVDERAMLPTILRFFQEAKTHMAMVFRARATGGRRGEEEQHEAVLLPQLVARGRGGFTSMRYMLGASHRGDSPTCAASAAEEEEFAIVGIVTMEDVVERLLNEDIYDEYDRDVGTRSFRAARRGAAEGPDDAGSSAAERDDDRRDASVTAVVHWGTGGPRRDGSARARSLVTSPRVNFYSYFSHPDDPHNVAALSDAQVWAVVYYLQRAVSCFAGWPALLLRQMLDECCDEVLVPPMPQTATRAHARLRPAALLPAPVTTHEEGSLSSVNWARRESYTRHGSNSTQADSSMATCHTDAAAANDDDVATNTNAAAAAAAAKDDGHATNTHAFDASVVGCAIMADMYSNRAASVAEGSLDKASSGVGAASSYTHSDLMGGAGRDGGMSSLWDVGEASRPPHSEHQRPSHPRPRMHSHRHTFTSTLSRAPSSLRNDHSIFLNQASDESYILYARGVHSDVFTLVLGGVVDMLVGQDNFATTMRSFAVMGERALTQSFYVPDFSAIVLHPARLIRIRQAVYERFLSSMSDEVHHMSRMRILSSSAPAVDYLSATSRAHPRHDSLTVHHDRGIEHDNASMAESINDEVFDRYGYEGHDNSIRGDGDNSARVHMSDRSRSRGGQLGERESARLSAYTAALQRARQHRVGRETHHDRSYGTFSPRL